MATYKDALSPIPELSLSDSAYNPSRVTTPTLPGSIDAFASPMKASLLTAPAAPPPTPAISTQQPRGIPTPTTPPVTPPATPVPTPAAVPAQTQTYLPPDEAQISQLVDQLDKQYGIKLGVGWREAFQLDPQGFLRQAEAIAADPNRYRGTVGGQNILAPGMLDAWLARVKSLYTQAAPQTDFTNQRNAIFDEAQARIQQQAASGGRAAEEELLSRLGSLGLLDSGIGAKVLADFRSGRAQDVSNALSELRQMLDTSALDVSTKEYLARLMSGLDLQSQMALLNKRAELERASQPSPWWNIAGAAIGALPALLSARAPNAITPSNDYSGGFVWDPASGRYVAQGFGPPAPIVDPYGLGR